MAAPLEITETHHRLLASLNTYRLLNTTMMRRVGVARSRETVADAARFLVRKNMAARTGAPLVSGVRRLPHLYWLTPKGAATLEKLDGTPALGAARRFGDLHEVMHRIGIVDIHIAARSWAAAAGVDLVNFTTDFEPGSRGRHKATTIEGANFRFTPDALAQVRLPGDATPRLLVIELERGGERNDLSPFFRHKLPHLRALSRGEYVERYICLTTLARYLVVFATDDMRDRALARWPESDADEWAGFFVKSLPELEADFGGGWHQPGRPDRTLFNLQPMGHGEVGG